METVVESQEPAFDDDDIDIDSILQGFHDHNFDLDLDLWLSNSSPSSDDSNSPKESDTLTSLSSFAEEIERFLMDDDNNEEVVVSNDDDFFTGLLVDGSGSGSDSRKSEVTTPDSGESEEAKEKKDDTFVGIDEEEGEGDDHVSKKRRRQMRNRDSAMKSRERKKIYVKDLEMKTKYLESECRHLDYSLRCCMAENFALHQRLQKERPLSATTARQESAVLFMESLLLGSLFWLVSIVCLFLVPSLQSPNLKDTSRLGRGLALEALRSKTVLNETVGPDLGYGLVTMRRRCRGMMRSRMKSFACCFCLIV